MDYLWSPWRYRYVSADSPGEECVFCAAAAGTEDAKTHVLLRAERNFVLLNLYPYTTGHVLIAPYQHVRSLSEADAETLEEMMRLAQRMEAALREVYRPDGFNLGLNIGESAGAGIPGHLHLHLVPRWAGDVNFMTAIGHTRVLPEDLDTTHAKIGAALKASER